MEEILLGVRMWRRREVEGSLWQVIRTQMRGCHEAEAELVKSNPRGACKPDKLTGIVRSSVRTSAVRTTEKPTGARKTAQGAVPKPPPLVLSQASAGGQDKPPLLSGTSVGQVKV